MIVLKSPKGWTGPKLWNNEAIEGSFRAHQVPVPVSAEKMEHIDALENWLKSYKPEELFDENAQLRPEIATIAPKGDRRMGKNPVANGGINPRAINVGDWTKFALDIKQPGKVINQDMVTLGTYLGELSKLNKDNFRVWGPDEHKSNRLYEMFKVTDRQWLEQNWWKVWWIFITSRKNYWLTTVRTPSWRYAWGLCFNEEDMVSLLHMNHF